MNDLVTVVVPIYNVEKYLRRCLKSILEQSYSNLEIFLINDGSTDKSGEICEEWAKKDDRIFYFKKNNEGLGATRNYGIERANGKYIAFIDSDDWWELDAIEKLYSAAEKNDADMTYMNFWWEDYQDDGTYKSRQFCQYCLFDGVSDASKTPDLIFSSDARTWSKFYKSDLFIKNNIRFPNHPFEDFPINPILVLSSRRICQVHEPLYHYDYRRTGNLTGNANNLSYISLGIEELYNELLVRNMYNTHKERFSEYVLKMCKATLNDLRLNDEKAKNEFYKILNKYCKDKIGFIKKNILFESSFTAYQMILKNCLRSQIVGRYIWNIPDNEYDLLKENENSHITNYNADCMIIDLLNWNENINIFKNECINRRNKILNDIREHNFQGKIFLIKLFLSETYGVDGNNLNEFENIEYIRRLNEILFEQYNILEENIKTLNKEIVTVKSDDLTVYTYTHTNYGCYPYYFNGQFYDELFKRIEKELN